MKKNLLTVLVVILAVILVALIAALVFLEGIVPQRPETTIPSPPPATDGQETTAPTSGTTAPTETEPVPSETTEPTIPGVENSIFDNDPTEPDEQDTEPAGKQTDPAENTNPTEPPKPGSLTYAEYQAMSGAEQRAYMETFADMNAFFEWYNAAKETYEKENPSIEVGGGTIDLEQIIGGKN